VVCPPNCANIGLMEDDMRKLPERFISFTKAYPEIAAAYETLAGKCRESGPLDERDQTLVKLGVAIGSGLEGSVHSQVRKSLDAGVNPDEIRHAFMLAMTAIGFPKTMATFTWAEDILKDE
jgi:alkylhydroperoxidase/carboxymuconolactone decarboxylase family protein YurZ